METEEPLTVEVTPEMIQAGWDVLAEAGLADDLLEADKLTVERVYLAMARLAPVRRLARGDSERY
jgi:hypothetical protein